MYSFTQQNIGKFTIYNSVQRIGDTHLKKFKAGVTPQNQETINVYVLGNFRFSVDGFTQDLPAGSTTLDLNIENFVEGSVATEEVLSTVAIRYCISAGNEPFSKQVAAVTAGSVFTVQEECVAFVLDGNLTIGTLTLGVGAYMEVIPAVDITGEGRLLVLA